LSTGPMLRVGLVRLGEEQHVLMFTMHHIISDGWSMGVLVRELTELYEGYATGEEVRLAELPIQYGDYSVWQRELLQGELLERQIKYWREELEGAPPVLQLPTDRPRPAVQTQRGASRKFRMSESLSESLREMSRSEGVTMFMLMLATERGAASGGAAPAPGSSASAWSSTPSRAVSSTPSGRDRSTASNGVR